MPVSLEPASVEPVLLWAPVFAEVVRVVVVAVVALFVAFFIVLLNLPSPLLVCMKLTDSSVREMSLMESDIVVSQIESLSICDIFSCLDLESSISASSMASFRVLMWDPLLTIFLLGFVAA